MRRCKHCKTELPPAAKCTDPHKRAGHCNAECAYEAYRAKQAQKADKEYKARTNELKRQHRLNDSKTRRAVALEVAQELARISSADDNGYCTCVTCGHVGRWNDGFDGGHYIPKSVSTYWMLDPRNIHPQCKSCNGNGMKYGGKEAIYTLWMIDTYGREFVEHMEAMSKKVTRRTAKGYNEFIETARAEIAKHKKRIGC